MEGQRRFFLKMLIPGAVFSSAAMLGTQAAKPPRTPSRGQFPQNPPPQSPPAVSAFPAPPSKAQLKANQKEIKKDVDQLFSLAQDLKEQAGKTDTVVVLSVGFVQKTEEIEKLAKRIRELARD
ncbi:MAG TPA: hypothetical protein VJN90_08025 [Candidatus Acidoferrales bacterium]|nr:hypothetical protein [Candidatus Acidoferrales bacterium]